MKFKWNDKLALEFAKVASSGAYRLYYGCPKLEQKLKRFKELKKLKKKNETKNKNMENKQEIDDGNDLIAQYLGITKSQAQGFYHTKKGLAHLTYHEDFNELLSFAVAFCDKEKASIKYENGEYTILIPTPKPRIVLPYHPITEKVVDGKTTYACWQVLVKAVQFINAKNWK